MAPRQPAITARRLHCDTIGAEQRFWHIPHLTLTHSAPKGGEGTIEVSRCARDTGVLTRP